MYKRQEHGNIVLRHLDGGGTHGSQLLALCQLAVIVVGAADLAAAVHHKPDAVSYTHLDVYKRQARTWVKGPILLPAPRWDA